MGSTVPRIYVACLAAYNNGRLHGAWIDATQDAADITSAIQSMLGASPVPGAEEWAIHDSEGFGALKIDEFEALDQVATLASMIEQHGEAFEAYASYHAYDIAHAIDTFEDAYMGTYDSAADYAEEMTLEGGAVIPDALASYIDWAAMARDWDMNGEVLFIDCTGKRRNAHDSVYVFNANVKR